MFGRMRKASHVEQMRNNVWNCLDSILQILQLNFNQLIKSLVQSYYTRIRIIARLKPVLPKNIVKQLINTLISSQLAYCNSLFICFLCDFSQILDTGNTTLQFWQLHWLPINYKIQFKGVFTPVFFEGVLSSIPPQRSDHLGICEHSNRQTSTPRLPERFFSAHFKLNPDAVCLLYKCKRTNHRVV